MTGPQTCDEAADLPLPDVLNGYQQLTDRDSMSRAIAALQARGEWNDDRSLDPADYPPLTAAEHLELIALGERLARHYRHPALVHHAVVAGATWEQIAAATGGDAGPGAAGIPGLGRGAAPASQRLPRRHHRPGR